MNTILNMCICSCKSNNVNHLFFIFSQILTKYVAIEPRVPVCLCVCVSVCLSDCAYVSSLQPILIGRYRWNFPQMIWKIFASDIFHGFRKFKMDDVMAPILYVFFIPALSRSQFIFDFLQNWAQGTKLSSDVCYWKSAKSVDNFRQYGEPRFRKKSKWPPKIFFFKSYK